MTHNEQVLNRLHDNFLTEDDLAPFEPCAVVFEDAKSEIINYVTDYIAEHDCLPDIDDVADRFSCQSETDYEALEQYFKREQFWLDREKAPCKMPSLK